MNLKVTVALIVVLAGLASYAYFVEHLGADKQAKEEQASKELFDGIAFDNVTRFDIESGGEKISIEKVQNPDYADDGTDSDKVDAEGRELINAEPLTIWMITSPIKAEASSSIVNSIRNALANCSITKIITEDPAADLKPFGLAPPQAQLSFTLNDKTDTVLIGNQSPISNTLYAKLADSPQVVQLSSTSLSYNAVKSVKAFREKRIFPRLTLPDVPRFTITGEQGEFVFARDAAVNKKWKIVSPIERNADKTKVEGMLRAFTNASAEEYIDENPGEYDSFGLAGDNLTRVIIERSSGRSTYELIIGSRAKNEKQFYVRRPDGQRVVTIDERTVDWLNFKIEDVYSRLMTEIVADDIFAFEVIRGEESYWLRKGEDTRFYLEGDLEKPVEVSQGRRMVNRFKNMRADRVWIYHSAELAGLGLTEPQMIVRFYDVGDTLLEEISIGKPVPENSNQLYGRNSREDFLYTLTQTFTQLFPEKDKLDSILDLPKAPIADSPAPDPDRDEDGLAITPRPDNP
jgi:Domain of unknown function (DUF4340)